MKLLSEKTKLNVKDWKSTATGILLAVVVILGAVGLLSPEQSSTLQTQGINIIDAVNIIVGAISSIILIFKTQYHPS
jgi:hypothetical protein